jgi:hypothetical protein
MCYSQQAKEQVVFNHFSKHFGPTGQRSITFDWNELHLGRRELSHLEEEFTEEELRSVIFDLQGDKAPGPDGFIGIFFKSSWNIIKGDLVHALHYFYNQHPQHPSHLNTAHNMLLPKKEDAYVVTDFRPVSLTHSIAKILSKILASRLAPELNGMVSRAQSAFIKRRSIQDNFLYTQNLTKALHRAKQPGLFLKLDIAKAFGTVSEKTL